MSKKLEPTWSKDERDQGEKEAAAWEEFFAAQEETDGNADMRRSNLAEQARIAEGQDKHEAELMALPNVAGVATSMKVKA